MLIRGPDEGWLEGLLYQQLDVGAGIIRAGFGDVLGYSVP